jgi:hypothetical protein
MNQDSVTDIINGGPLLKRLILVHEILGLHTSGGALASVSTS